MSVPEPDKIQPNPEKLPELPSTGLLINQARQFGIRDLISRFQPTGIRIVLNLPFVGDDCSYLFTIKHNPYIPWFDSIAGDNKVFHWNNTFPVAHHTIDTDDISESGVHISQHSPPPILSYLSMAHRFWRGSIRYRLKTVSNFATQGYMFVAPLKNTARAVALYDSFTTSPYYVRQDHSYTDAMMNSYIDCDVSQIRHVEWEVPFELNVPYYDQYACLDLTSDATKVGTTVAIPHADNFSAVGLRGTLSSTNTSNQVMFELEYCAGEDFEFSGEYLYPYKAFATTATAVRNDTSKSIFNQAYPYTIPNSTYYNDGKNIIAARESTVTTTQSTLTTDL